MNRLTEYRKDLKRYEYKLDEKGYCYISEGQIVNKLGKLEDLEEQLGCPLDVFVKALTNGIYKYMYFDKDNPVFRHFDELTTNGESLFFEYLRRDTYGQDEYGDVYLKDYKKTWWLKEDRSE